MAEKKKRRRRKTAAAEEEEELVMAAGAGEKERKRRNVAVGKRKLLPGEKVEVLYSDEGLNGSWHEGVVIACRESSRLVAYVHLLGDDNCSKLSESISVSAAIEGLSTRIPERHRGHIRPLPPLCEMQASEIRYGLCVDALVDDAWWEGVVFDSEEGSLERSIFFPDQGDVLTVMVDQLRFTQEWNEVSGQWKPRGEWLLLQVLEPFKQEDGLPVSVREIWYDLRTMVAFWEKIGLWMLGSPSVWRAMVSELIQELVFVANDLTIISGIPCEMDGPLGDFHCIQNKDVQGMLEDQPLVELSGSSKKKTWDASNHRDNEVIEASRKDHENGTHVLSSLHNLDEKTGVSPQALSNYIYEYQSTISSRPLFSRKISSVTCQNARSYLLSTGWTIKGRDKRCKHYVSPEGKRYYSLIKCCKAWKELEDEGSSQNAMNFKGISNSLLYDKQDTEANGSAEGGDTKANGCTGVSEPWQPVDLEAEFFPQAIELCAYGLKGVKTRLEESKLSYVDTANVYLQVKKHLLALGWRVESRRHKWLRLRLISPKGKCFNSLHKVCRYLMNRPGKHRDGDENSLSGSLLSGKEYGQLAAVYHKAVSSKQDSFVQWSPRKKGKHQIEPSEEGDANTNMTDRNTSKPSSEMIYSDSLVYSKSKEDSFAEVTVQRLTDGDCVVSGKENLALCNSEMKSFRNEDHQSIYFLEAIVNYKAYMDTRQAKDKHKLPNEDTKMMRLKAKTYLQLKGWRLRKSKLRKSKGCDIFYASPDGKGYRSLYAACTAYLEDQFLRKNTASLLESITTKRVRDTRFKNSSLKGSQSRLDNAFAAKASGNSHNSVQEKCTENGFKNLSISSKFDELKCGLLRPRGSRISKKRRSSFYTSNNIHGRRTNQQDGCSCRRRSEKGKKSQRFVRCMHKTGRSSLAHMLQSIDGSGQLEVSSFSQSASKTILSLLVDSNVVLPRQKVRYIHRRDGRVLMEGRITRDGIKCTCCKKVYGLSSFEAHAGSSIRKPAANIFLQDGRSLLQCQMQMLQNEKSKDFHRGRLKCNYSQYQSDTICSICHEGGTLILCDHCPSSFHLQCIGLEELPEGKWFCASCRCCICGLSEYNSDIEQFTQNTIMYCDQCERQYHVGCLRNKGFEGLTSCPVGNWFCSKTCSQIFLRLRKLVGKPKSTAIEGLSWTMLRSSKESVVDSSKYDLKTMAKHNSKLYLALEVLHECFVPIVEPRTRSDPVADLLVNKESELNRLNFQGFYTMLLERGDELISVATVRVYGDKVAEVPLIGTRANYRRQGMCRLLIDELEKLLSGLGVERLLLPAVPQLLETWTKSFEFIKMSTSDILELSGYTFLNFQGTTMCQKFLRTTKTVSEKSRGNYSQITDRSLETTNNSDHCKYSSADDVVKTVKPLKALPSCGDEAYSSPSQSEAIENLSYQCDDAISPSVSSYSDNENNVSRTVQREVNELASVKHVQRQLHLSQAETNFSGSHD